MERSLINTVIGLGVLALTVYVVGKAWKKSQETKSSAIGNGTVKKPLKNVLAPITRIILLSRHDVVCINNKIINQKRRGNGNEK